MTAKGKEMCQLKDVPVLGCTTLGFTNNVNGRARIGDQIIWSSPKYKKIMLREKIFICLINKHYLFNERVCLQYLSGANYIFLIE